MICWMDQKSFTRLTLTPDYRTTSEIQRAQGLLEEVLPTIPDAELLYGVFYNENTEYCSFEQSRICFRRNGILFRINKQYSPKPTYAIDIDTSNFKHIDLHMQARIRDKYPAPHRIGVLSERKVNIWVDYLTKIWHDLEHLDFDRSVVARRSVKGPVSDRRSLRLRCLDRCGLDGKVDALPHRDLPVLIKSVFGHRLVRIDNFKPSAPASRSVRRFLSVCRDA